MTGYKRFKVLRLFKRVVLERISLQVELEKTIVSLSTSLIPV